MDHYVYAHFNTKQACFKFMDYCNQSPNYLGMLDFHTGFGEDYYLKFDFDNIRDLHRFGQDVAMFGGIIKR